MGLLVLLSFFVVLHLLILFRVIPFQMVWGGRVKDTAQMITFESISLFFNLAILAVVATDAKILNLRISQKVLQIAYWSMFVLFLLNTAGNLLSSNEVEKYLFTPVTLLLSLFSLRMAISKKKAKSSIHPL